MITDQDRSRAQVLAVRVHALTHHEDREFADILARAGCRPDGPSGGDRLLKIVTRRMADHYQNQRRSERVEAELAEREKLLAAVGERMKNRRARRPAPMAAPRTPAPMAAAHTPAPLAAPTNRPRATFGDLLDHPGCVPAFVVTFYVGGILFAISEGDSDVSTVLLVGALYGTFFAGAVMVIVGSLVVLLVGLLLAIEWFGLAAGLIRKS